MSIGTKSKDREGPFYPQRGTARGVVTDGADNNTANRDGGDHSGLDTDSDAVADAIDSEEPWRKDGTPEPWGPDAGATTAEYAITTLAACGFAALLVVILKSEPIKELVTGVIETALGLGV